MRIRRVVRHPVTTALETLDLTVTPGLGRYLHGLQASGLPLVTVFDIGAHTGEWTRLVSRHLPSTVEFVLFEANPTHAEALRATGRRVVTAVLSDNVAETEFFASGGTGDSLFRENTKNYDDVAATCVTTTTLDRVCAELRLPSPDLVKIDTQGSELAILAGGDTVLADTKLLYLEMPIMRYNVGAPSFDDYLRAVSDMGFIPVGQFESHVGNGALLQVDILFMRHATFETVFGSDNLEHALRLT
jgi:FkbM family methyltransferase